MKKLHVVNRDFQCAVEALFAVPGLTGGRVFDIAPENPREYVNQDQPEVFRPREHALAGNRWSFPARSDLDLEP